MCMKIIKEHENKRRIIVKLLKIGRQAIVSCENTLERACEPGSSNCHCLLLDD